MNQTMKRGLLLLLTWAFLSCASAPEEPVRFAAVTTSVSQMDRGAAALARFRPEREAVLEGGECLRVPPLDARGQRYTVHFPSRTAPETSISIFVSADGSVVRYSESRGVPKPGKSVAEMQAEMDRMPQTLIHLDYVTGEATATNHVPGQARRGVMGTVAEFEESAVLGDLRGRAELVRSICSGR